MVDIIYNESESCLNKYTKFWKIYFKYCNVCHMKAPSTLDGLYHWTWYASFFGKGQIRKNIFSKTKLRIETFSERALGAGPHLRSDIFYYYAISNISQHIKIYDLKKKNDELFLILGLILYPCGSYRKNGLFWMLLCAKFQKKKKKTDMSFSFCKKYAFPEIL